MDLVWTMFGLLWFFETQWDLFETSYGDTYALDLDFGLWTMDIGLNYTSNHIDKHYS